MTEQTTQSDPGCICRGNWRAIVKKYEPLIGRRYVAENGKRWTFVGLLHADDDYYYLLSRKGKHQMLSCVGDIEGFGFELEENDKISVHAMRAIAVEAIREATGCADIIGKDGKSLVDKLERTALLAARSMG